MPYFLLNHKYEIIEEREDRLFTTKGYLTIKAESRENISSPIKSVNLGSTHSLSKAAEWNFSLLPASKRKVALKLYEDKNFDKLKSLITQYNVSPSPLCCGDYSKVITREIKKAISNGSLEV